VIVVCHKCLSAYTEASWAELPAVGIQHVGCRLGINDGGMCCALRNCSCGSTLGVEVRCDLGVEAQTMLSASDG
jgi:hypothetical protein